MGLLQVAADFGEAHAEPSPIGLLGLKINVERGIS